MSFVVSSGKLRRCQVSPGFPGGVAARGDERFLHEVAAALHALQRCEGGVRIGGGGKAEKPAPEFFRAIFAEIKRPLSEWDHVVYVGDSEKNDILPARSLGICTVRYLNKRTPLNTLWIDSTVESVADYQCSDRKQLLSIFRKILKK